MNSEAGPNGDIEILRRVENDRIEKEAELERSWWGEETINDPVKAISTGQLVRVPDEGVGYRLWGKLIKGEESPYLRPDALILMKVIARTWHYKVRSFGLDSNCSLSVISLFRSHEDQERMRKETWKATKGASSHTSGVAIDFDPRSYYAGDPRKSMKVTDQGYNIQYMDLFRETLAEFERIEACHVIYERDYKTLEKGIEEYNACYHVCMIPRK